MFFNVQLVKVSLKIISNHTSFTFEQSK